MKTLNKTVLIAAAIAGLLLFSFQAVKKGRSNETRAERALRQIDGVLLQTVERRVKLGELLRSAEENERTLMGRAADELRLLDESQRAELRTQFKSGELSEKNKADIKIAGLYANYRDAVVQRRRTSNLRSEFERCSFVLDRAFAARERLEQQIAAVKALGADPGDVVLGDGEQYRVFDELLALSETRVMEEPLTPNDVVTENDEGEAAASAIFDGLETNADAETNAGAGETRALENDRLAERIERFKSEIEGRNVNAEGIVARAVELYKWLSFGDKIFWLVWTELFLTWAAWTIAVKFHASMRAELCLFIVSTIYWGGVGCSIGRAYGVGASAIGAAVGAGIGFLLNFFVGLLVIEEWKFHKETGVIVAAAAWCKILGTVLMRCM